MLGNSKVTAAADILRTALGDAAPVVDTAAERFQLGANRHAEAVEQLADQLGLAARRVDDALETVVLVVFGICAAVAVGAVVSAIVEWTRGDQ